MRTKPSLVDSPKTLADLERAFMMGFTFEQAAHYAKCHPSSIHKHVKNKTPIIWKGVELTFDQLVLMWRGYLGTVALRNIYKVLTSPILTDAVVELSWKWLERTRPEEFGGICRSCFRKCKELHFV